MFPRYFSFRRLHRTVRLTHKMTMFAMPCQPAHICVSYNKRKYMSTNMSASVSVWLCVPSCIYVRLFYVALRRRPCMQHVDRLKLYIGVWCTRCILFNCNCVLLSISIRCVAKSRRDDSFEWNNVQQMRANWLKCETV